MAEVISLPKERPEDTALESISKPMPNPHPLLRAGHLGGWFQAESGNFKGFLCERKCWWKDCQAAVDQVATSGELGEKEEVIVRTKRGPDGFGDVNNIADEILDKVTLPKDVKDAVRNDICELGTIVPQLCSWCDCLVVKLELIGEKNCKRWHRDFWCARAIVTYNSAGTLYTGDENVNFWELEHKGTNERIIRDISEIHSAGVGDILFIKGVKYPDPVKGLIHRSPEAQYHDSGLVRNRLVLKVDVPEPEAWQEEDCDCCP